MSELNPAHLEILTSVQREIALSIVLAVDGRDATDVIHAMISLMAATINQSTLLHVAS